MKNTFSLVPLSYIRTHGILHALYRVYSCVVRQSINRFYTRVTVLQL